MNMGKKYSVNEHFFDAWNDAMAYVLGYLCADGHITHNASHRTHYVCFTSTDRERLEAIKALLASSHQIQERVKLPHTKPVYQIRIGSGSLYARLSKLGVEERKSLILRYPSVPKRYESSFIRGYFDGDGCSFLERSAIGRPKRLLVVFTSGSKAFLSALSASLSKNAGLAPRRILQHGSSETTYQLRYSTRDSLKLYLYLYTPSLDPKLYLARKYAIFSEYLAVRGLCREDIPGILITKGPVVK